MNLIKMLFSRMGIIAGFLILQMVVIFLALTYFRDNYAYVQAIYLVITVMLSIYILRKRGSYAYKALWIALIALLPIFGSAMFLLMSQSWISEERRLQLGGTYVDLREYYPFEKVPLSELKKKSNNAALQAEYLDRAALAPLYKNSVSEYLKSGEIFFERLLEDIGKAERFIYLEFFIIDNGMLWDCVLELLEQKAAEGVDVRVIYDDIGTILRMPGNYPEKLMKKGIKCGVFQRFLPVITGTYMNRDHRKICVIDGVVAYTGGVNLADEYANIISRFGHWYDSGIRIEGEAAYSFMIMFLSMWSYVFNREGSDKILEIPDVCASLEKRSDGYMVPFCDSPVDDEPVGMCAYINMISKAKRYIYICTPYLSLDESILSALSIAVKSGVDVRIIVPGVPDKKLVNMVTKSYYGPLLNAGVRVYEYSPGFIHSKTIVSDDKYGICGSINFSFRSFFFNHESAVWLYNTKSVIEMRDAFSEVLPECAEISKEAYDSIPYLVKLARDVLSIFAPIV